MTLKETVVRLEARVAALEAKVAAQESDAALRSYRQIPQFPPAVVADSLYCSACSGRPCRGTTTACRGVFVPRSYMPGGGL